MKEFLKRFSYEGSIASTRSDEWWRLLCDRYAISQITHSCVLVHTWAIKRRPTNKSFQKGNWSYNWKNWYPTQAATIRRSQIRQAASDCLWSQLLLPATDHKVIASVSLISFALMCCNWSRCDHWRSGAINCALGMRSARLHIHAVSCAPEWSRDHLPGNHREHSEGKLKFNWKNWYPMWAGAIRRSQIRPATSDRLWLRLVLPTADHNPSWLFHRV